MRISVFREQTDLEQARGVLEALADAGVDYDDLTQTLEREGVDKFADSFDELIRTLTGKRDALARV